MSERARRAKISVTVDTALLRAVDSYIEAHASLDRSKIVDAALELWYAAQQNEAMAEQYSAPEGADEAAEYRAWRQVRRAGASRLIAGSGGSGPG